MRQAARTMMAGLLLVATSSGPLCFAATDAEGTLAQAKRLVEAKNYAQAATLLEDLLTEADAKQRRSILDLLHQSYEAMARDAKAAGNDREAAHLLDNIAIIDQSRGKPAARAESPDAKPARAAIAPNAKPKPAATKPKIPGTVALTNPRPQTPVQALPSPAQDAAPQLPPEPVLAADPAKKQSPKSSPPPLLIAADESPQPPVTAPKLPTASDDSTRAPISTPKPPAVSDDSAQRREASPKPPAVSLAEGDRLFGERRYEEAGRCYAELARQNALPAYRKQHWAYCRMREVARRVNLRPQSTQEWDEIAAEIGNIQRLAPSIWYGEYLRNKVAEVRRSGRRPLAKSDTLVVRASGADETQTKPKTDPESRLFPRLSGKSRSGANPPPDPKPPAAATPAVAGEAPLNLPGGPSEPAAMLAVNAGARNALAPPDPDGGARALPALNASAGGATTDAAGAAWQIYETPNFRVFHQDARLAETAANAAEAVRREQAKRWASPAAQRPWTPRCDLYLYPTGKLFARETNQPEASPGFSTMNCISNRVVARRVNLRADHPLIVTAILPHEVTHVVLADIFTTQQIPRWADEGIAVLAEPDAEQETRAAELQEPLEAGRVFDLRELMAMEYPAAKDWSLYYAQSVSLTRFLVDRGQPELFVKFVQNSQRDGIEGALRGTYGIASLAELQDRWTKYARQRSAPIKEARREPVGQPGAAAVR